MRVSGKSMPELATLCAIEPPKEYVELFEDIKAAMGVTKGELIFLSKKKEREVCPKLVYIGQLGSCEGGICYVLETDAGVREQRRVILHEALHLILGSHPWPHEKEKE